MVYSICDKKTLKRDPEILKSDLIIAKRSIWPALKLSSLSCQSVPAETPQEARKGRVVSVLKDAEGST